MRIALGNGLSCLLSEYCNSQDLQRVESCMADDRSDAAPALHVHPCPEGAQCSRGDHRIPSLHQVTEADRDADDPDSDRRAAEILLEPAEHRSEEHTSELQSRLHLVC